MIDVTRADRGQIRFVIDHLRDLDAAEMVACEMDFARLPDQIMRARVFAFCACDFNDGPVAIWGMLQRRTGVGAGFAFGSSGWDKAATTIVRNIRRFVVPFLLANNYHRVEALGLAHRTDIARFMTLIGAQPEAVLRGYGVHGEDFISYRWLADEHRSTRAEERHTAH
ncbi:hypothetical protein QIH85_24070 [Bradyrhizobium japonicum]|uniref:hypothetical protein n=1 Tax=Bradyrhizobium japonicum TaxID=375 RepID=UPI0027155901|nr:hypothetical protein [Bradyrhizobium japonicum]WLB24961.1 hypothetical protein QIH85_24070 [Bradyrhizobium japonicum]